MLEALTVGLEQVIAAGVILSMAAGGGARRSDKTKNRPFMPEVYSPYSILSHAEKIPRTGVLGQ